VPEAGSLPALDDSRSLRGPGPPLHLAPKSSAPAEIFHGQVGRDRLSGRWPTQQKLVMVLPPDVVEACTELIEPIQMFLQNPPPELEAGVAAGLRVVLQYLEHAAKAEVLHGPAVAVMLQDQSRHLTKLVDGKRSLTWVEGGVKADFGHQIIIELLRQLLKIHGLEVGADGAGEAGWSLADMRHENQNLLKKAKFDTEIRSKFRSLSLKVEDQDLLSRRFEHIVSVYEVPGLDKLTCDGAWAFWMEAVGAKWKVSGTSIHIWRLKLVGMAVVAHRLTATARVLNDEGHKVLERGRPWRACTVMHTTIEGYTLKEVISVMGQVGPVYLAARFASTSGDELSMMRVDRDLSCPFAFLDEDA
jgi:hypothetical protein